MRAVYQRVDAALAQGVHQTLDWHHETARARDVIEQHELGARRDQARNHLSSDAETRGFITLQEHAVAAGIANNVFERNNATVGVVIRFPFFSPSQRAHAEAADAEAVRANKEVESTKNQVSQQTLKLRHSVEQLQAAQEVSELEYEIAQSNVEAMQIKIKSGTATLNEGDQVRADLSAKYNALQDANFELTRARIALLRATGELQSWVDQSK